MKATRILALLLAMLMALALFACGDNETFTTGEPESEQTEDTAEDSGTDAQEP